MRKLKNEELNRIAIDDFKNAEKLNACIILDGIRSLNNVGSTFRTSDSFRIKKIWLCGITGTPPHRDINKTALGATDSVDWEYVEDTSELIQKLKEEGWSICSIEQADESIMLDEFKPKPKEKYAFVFGNEVFGVSDAAIEASDYVLEIPQHGTKHSLNISVSVGIVVWDFFTKVGRSFK